MIATITPKPETSEAEVTIAVSADEFTPYLERAAKKLSKDAPLKGFRPGKADLKAALEAYGTDRIVQEAVERAIPHFFVEAVLDHDLEAIGRPAVTIETSSPADGLKFTATVAVLPQVTLGDLAGISVSKRAVSVSDDEVEKELKYLAKLRSTPIEVARPAQMGDTVTVDFKVSMDGAVMEGGESKNHPVHLGEGHFVPEFEEKLQGITANDEREFTINFPDDYARANLRGKQAQVWVKAHAVQKRVIPELNDEFAKKVGKFATLAELKTELKKNMAHEKEHKEDERFQGELADKLAEATTFGPIPQVLIEGEIDRRLQEFAQLLTYQQKTIEEYLTQHQKTPAQLREEMREVAERAVKVSLALRTLAVQENIAADESEVEEKVQAYLARFANTKAAQEQVDIAELKDSFTSTIRNQKTLKRLTELVNVTTESAPATTA